jgi:hypothetical protein
MVSYALEQLVEVEGGASARIVVMGAQECVTCAPPMMLVVLAHGYDGLLTYRADQDG